MHKNVKNIFAVLLVIILLFTVTMPTSAMNEINIMDDKNLEEQIVDNGDDNNPQLESQKKEQLEKEMKSQDILEDNPNIDDEETTEMEQTKEEIDLEKNKNDQDDFKDDTSIVAESDSNNNEENIAVNSIRPYSSITGVLPDSITGLEKLYYGSVANDPTAPFHNAEQLQDILENGDESYAKAVWEKYRYDLYDPNFQKRGGCGALIAPSGNKYDNKKPDTTGKPDYADELLESTGHAYPKDSNSPFHTSVEAQIEPVENGTLVNGALVESDKNAFKNLQKTASPDIGDSNSDREYIVDLKATADLKQVKPMAMIFQIQTSWQMFDTLHANDRASLVNGQAVTQDLLSLYEMKQGFLDFMEWMKQNTDGSLLIGITNFQHSNTNSLVNAPYFTNDTDSIIKGLYGWDTFGDCEHIHYSSSKLKAAQIELNFSDNFENWVDAKNTSIYKNAEMVSVIIGGACEAADLKSNSVNLPTIPNGVIKQQYGIRTNSGTGVIANDMISWLDYCAQGDSKNKTAGAFDTGKYYKDVTTREQFFNTLKDIYADAQEKAPNQQKVTDVVLEDTITAEFEVNQSAIKVYIDGTDVTSSANIQVAGQADGTTKVSCTVGEVAHKQEVHLQISVKAKKNFIGSNNVYTNQGIPTISYKGRIDNTIYTQNFTDTPAVNVPIRFSVSNGETISLEPGNSVDLADLAKESSGLRIMTKEVEDSLDKYAQTEGTLTYQWVDEEGNPVGDPTSAEINGDNRTPPEIPAYTVSAKEDDIGKQYKYKLKVTFTPAEVKENTTSKVAVSAKSEEGNVGIDVVQKPEGKVYIKKVIDNYQEKLSDDTFIIRVVSEGNTESQIDTEVVLQHNETSSAITIKEKTVLDISEVVPKEYEMSDISLSGEGKINGSQVTVDRGENIVITVHNKYSAKPFFHISEAIKNQFKQK